ncbi:MAG: NAD(P)H-quinone oxidoreductase [Gemmatimonadaceae bacterium]
MRAIVNTAPGGSDVLDLRELPSPNPGSYEIRVAVRASALNRADISQRKGAYAAPAGAPKDIPGLEYSGEVESVGEHVTLWKTGDRVMGLVGGGAHAELLCTHEREAISIPARLTFEEAAAIPEAFLTAYDAIFRQLRLQVGQRLLIHAAGSGVGTAAIQLSSLAGLKVVGTSRSADKLEKARHLGLQFGITASGDNWPDRVLEIFPSGVDAVLDLVGGPYLAGNMKAVMSRGQIVVVGLTAGRRQDIDLGLLLHKRIHIFGTVLRSRAIEEKISLSAEFSSKVLHSFDDGSLVPVIDTVMSFANVREAHDSMESNDTFGKIVLTWSS